MKKHGQILRMVLSALFLALAYLLPFLTGQIAEIGAMLCPMHIPVLLCGFLAGWRWGLAVGFAAPLFRALTLGMPPFFPVAVCMALELAVYGAASGLFRRLLARSVPFLYVSLISAMLLGRLVWGCAMFVCLAASGGRFTLAAFLAGAVTGSLPGIAVQILLIPPLVLLLERLQKGGAPNAPFR